MNWAAISFDWNQVRAFLATAEEGSLSAAARAVGQTQPTLGRQVAALEDELGVILFERIGKRLELTPAGQQILHHVRDMGEAAARLSLTASGQSRQMSGEVRITCSEVFSTSLMPAFLMQLRQEAPDLTIDLVANNSVMDLQRREADIAIRHIRPDQPDLIARLVGQAKAQFYAAETYLNNRAAPKTLKDLEGHDFVRIGNLEENIAFMRGLGVALEPSHYRAGSDNGDAAWSMTEAGLGISVMAKIVGDDSPHVRRILPDVDPIEFPVWLVSHRELHTAQRIRFVFDRLFDFLQKMCA